ncbi:hypothetical protein DPMN_119576 [Dreissena polymorpha]|uniref:Uncharacterized protein n=1 Tax=Dreissena polymorpha TaxID=45954 RepID=A0A9D4GM88_DREPO|nr:hypothetical protein DPMN_119576 [Dreissena polymorpha]
MSILNKLYAEVSLANLGAVGRLREGVTTVCGRGSSMGYMRCRGGRAADVICTWSVTGKYV